MSNVTIHISNTIHDHEAHRMSLQTDPVKDREKFANSPGMLQFVRPASLYEKMAYGLKGSNTAITEVSLVQRSPGVVGTARLTWDPAKGKRPSSEM